MRRPVRQIAVVIIGVAHLREPGIGIAAIGRRQSAIERIPARSLPRFVEELFRKLPGGVRIESRSGKIPAGEIEDRLGRNVGFAMDLAAAGPASASTTKLREIRWGRGGVADVLVPVHVADSGAIEAGIS